MDGQLKHIHGSHCKKTQKVNLNFKLLVLPIVSHYCVYLIGELERARFSCVCTGELLHIKLEQHIPALFDYTKFNHAYWRTFQVNYSLRI